MLTFLRGLLGQYAGLVTQLDEAMRQIVEVSKRRGMWENTLLWAFADNGADISHGASNWPFRGSKGTSCSHPLTHPHVSDLCVP